MHMTFTTRLEKRRKIVQSSFYFLPVDDHERSLSFLSEACNGNKYVHASMKRHAAFPSTPNKLWVRNTSCFCQNCFGHLLSLKQHAMVGEWLI